MSCDLHWCGFAEPTPWGDSALDFAVGRGPGVHTGRDRLPRAALAHARLGAGAEVEAQGAAG